MLRRDRAAAVAVWLARALSLCSGNRACHCSTAQHLDAMPIERRRTLSTSIALVATWCLLIAPVCAETVSIAVASNVAAPMQRIAAVFEAETSHKVRLSFGSTGKLYAQIMNGGPFQVLLAADESTPIRLATHGKAVAATRFTYAVGALVLWSPDAALVDAQGDVLKNRRFERLAIANPTVAPYGVAAVQTLEKLGLTGPLQPHLVRGENIAQAFQFVATGNAQLGFLALSQVMVDGALTQGSAWRVPPSYHDPIRQDAIVLAAGRNSLAAAEMMEFLRGKKARAILKAAGYSF
jgi:molybdate transport system substrate-binding protein